MPFEVKFKWVAYVGKTLSLKTDSIFKLVKFYAKDNANHYEASPFEKNGYDIFLYFLGLLFH